MTLAFFLGCLFTALSIAGIALYRRDMATPIEFQRRQLERVFRQ